MTALQLHCNCLADVHVLLINNVYTYTLVSSHKTHWLAVAVEFVTINIR